MGEPSDDLLTAQLLRGLRVAQSIILLVILLGLSLPNLLARLDDYSSAAVGLWFFGALLVVAVVDAVLVAARRSWGPVRWPAAAYVLVLSSVTSADLPASGLVAPQHWTLGAVGWFGLALFYDTSLRHVLIFIGVHTASTMALLIAAGRTDPATFVQLATVLVAITGFQLSVALAGSALRAVAAAATAAAAAQAAAVTREAVARQVHDDRATRYRELRASVLPLLRGIGDGTAPAADPAVRRRAAREAGRMRRLFAEDGDTGDPLAAELAALVDVVERRGVSVRFIARPVPFVPPPAVRRALLDEVVDILMGAEGAARVTLGATKADVVVSVISDGAGSPGPGHRGIHTTTITDGAQTWVEARWNSQAALPTDHGS